ncbi:MAG: hypothetical protein ACRCZ0_08625 [Cetobacterium sp.]
MRAIHKLNGFKEIEIKSGRPVRGESTWDVVFTTNGVQDSVRNTEDLGRYVDFLSVEYSFYE